MLTGLSASIAFASGIVNLGQPGQLLMGALAATLGGLYLHLPPPVLIPVLLLLAMAGGCAWAGVAALLRLAFNMNEFIVTLMLNMIADFFTAWVITYPFMDPEAYSPMTPPIDTSGWMPEIGGFNLSTLVTCWQRWRSSGSCSTAGGPATSGASPGRTRSSPGWAAAIRNKNFTAVMLITGALAGLAGGLIIMAGPHRFLRGPGRQLRLGRDHDRHRGQQRHDCHTALRPLLRAIQTGALGMELMTNVPSEIIAGAAGRAGAGDRRQPRRCWNAAA